MLKERIQADIIVAMKASEKEERDLLRFIMSQIKSKEKELQRDLIENEIIDVLKKEIRQTQEARAIADSTFLRWREACVEKYLPKQLTSAQIEALVLEAKLEFPLMKDCMGFCMKEYGAVCDKRKLSAAIRAMY